MEMN
ncbi:hypothetical protein TIFTF001_011599 [Ficus carica]